MTHGERKSLIVTLFKICGSITTLRRSCSSATLRDANSLSDVSEAFGLNFAFFLPGERLLTDEIA
jgi:hypothetical protein